MRKIFPGLLLLVLMIFTACAAQKIDRSEPQVKYVQLWRTACFGKCPIYKVEVYDNGLVRYTGIHFVSDTGIYEKNIGSAEAAKILNQFSVNRVDTLQNAYKANIADLPGINYVFQYGNTTKQVSRAEFGPTFLRELAGQVDKLVKNGPSDPPEVDRTWKKVSNSPKGD